MVIVYQKEGKNHRKSKQSVKKAVNPFYGKKGMGYVNNPKKAVYNKIYSRASERRYFRYGRCLQ